MESCVLALIGAAAGVGLAAITIRVLSVYAANIVPRVDEVSIDWVVLSFALVCALVVGRRVRVAPVAARRARTGTGAARYEPRNHRRTRSSADSRDAHRRGGGAIGRAPHRCRAAAPQFRHAATGRRRLRRGCRDDRTRDAGERHRRSIRQNKRRDFWRRLTDGSGRAAGHHCACRPEAAFRSPAAARPPRSRCPGHRSCPVSSHPRIGAWSLPAILRRWAFRCGGATSQRPTDRTPRRHHRQRGARAAVLARTRSHRQDDRSAQPWQSRTHGDRRRRRPPQFRARWRDTADGLLLRHGSARVRTDVSRLAQRRGSAVAHPAPFATRSGA